MCTNQEANRTSFLILTSFSTGLAELNCPHFERGSMECWRKLREVSTKCMNTADLPGFRNGIQGRDATFIANGFAMLLLVFIEEVTALSPCLRSLL